MIILGDINGDGKIDGNDVILLKAHIEGRTSLTLDSAIAADINKDGTIDTQDLALLKKHLTGEQIINEVIE